MEWQAWSDRLTDVLGLRSKPVAVTYTDNPPEGGSERKCRACTAITRAARGEVINLSAENSACPGGSMYLGFRASPPEAQRALREFLISGEKLFSCEVAVHRMTAMSKVKPPMGLADYAIFSPLDQAVLAPDVTIVTCNAWQAARLVNLAWYETGLPMECDPSGALCRGVVAYPVVTGNVNVSFGDVTARRSERQPEDELFVSLPFADLRSVMWALDRSSAGTAPVEIPAAMRVLMQHGGDESPEL